MKEIIFIYSYYSHHWHEAEEISFQTSDQLKFKFPLDY